MTFFSTPMMEPDQQGIEELPISTSRYIGESFLHGFEESPGAQAYRATQVWATDPSNNVDPSTIPNLYDPTAPPPEAPKIPMDEARKRVKEAGLEHQLPNLGNAPEMNERALDVMMRHTRERQYREANLARGPTGFLPGVASFGASFVGGALDPLSQAAFLMPIVGEVRRL